MKVSTVTLAALIGVATAMPQGSVYNELSGACKKVTFIWARGQFRDAVTETLFLCFISWLFLKMEMTMIWK
jgi:hypothetical protein